MPNQIRKIRNKNLYRITNMDTGKIESYGTTLEKARRQVRLLHMIDSQKHKKRH